MYLRIKTASAFIPACFLIMAGCSPKDAPVSEPEIESVIDNAFLTEITDRGGSVLHVDCRGTRPELTLKAPAQESMFVPVKIRFQDAAADALFRKRADFAVNELDYWTYEEDSNGYDVGFPTVFMDAMIIADRVFLELVPEDGTSYPMVFDINNHDRAKVSDCSERNKERVDQEMRRLGLGKYDTSPKLPEHPIPTADEASLLTLYDEFAIAVDRANALLAPSLTEDHEEAMHRLTPKGFEDGTPYTTVMEYFFKEFPENTGVLNSFVSDYGFEGNDQWLKVGDRYHTGLAAMKLERSNPGWVETHRYISGQQWDGMVGREKAVAGVLASMSDQEVEYFKRAYERKSAGTP